VCLWWLVQQVHFPCCQSVTSMQVVCTCAYYYMWSFCLQPDSEEGNEMVFCDSCNICVHQACYGITTIPSGSWLCRTCALSLRPECVLCPNKGGAMKCTRSGQKWAHVSCALWIPEVSIGCVERMEPITKISSIPVSLSWGVCSFMYLKLFLLCYLFYSGVLQVCLSHSYII
jgi:hypothetical protein